MKINGKEVSSLKVKQLMVVAQKWDIPGRSTMKKADLIVAVESCLKAKMAEVKKKEELASPAPIKKKEKPMTVTFNPKFNSKWVKLLLPICRYGKENHARQWATYMIGRIMDGYHDSKDKKKRTERPLRADERARIKRDVMPLISELLNEEKAKEEFQAYCEDAATADRMNAYYKWDYMHDADMKLALQMYEEYMSETTEETAKWNAGARKLERMMMLQKWTILEDAVHEGIESKDMVVKIISRDGIWLKSLMDDPKALKASGHSKSGVAGLINNAYAILDNLGLNIPESKYYRTRFIADPLTGQTMETLPYGTKWPIIDHPSLMDKVNREDALNHPRGVVAGDAALGGYDKYDQQ